MTFDIMMPFYGDFALFRVAVRSVLAQTDPDIRLVVVDDVYPDLEPGRWLQSLGDDRVEYIRNEQNLGVSGNFMRCVELARSEHVCIIGCDDVMLPGYVARIRELEELAPDADIIQPGVRVIDEHGAQSMPLADRVKRLAMPRGPRPVVLSGEQLAASLARGNWCYFPSVAWRAETVRGIGFRDDLRMVQDIALMFAIIQQGGTMILDDREVFAYRRHSSSISMAGQVDGTRFAEERTVSAEAAAAFDALQWPAAARAARAHVTSRLNAIASMLGPASRGRWADVHVLLRHALARGAATSAAERRS